MKINWYELLNILYKTTGKPKKYFTRKAGFCGAVRQGLTKNQNKDITFEEGTKLLELFKQHCPDKTPPQLKQTAQKYCSSCGRTTDSSKVYRVRVTMYKCEKCTNKAFCTQQISLTNKLTLSCKTTNLLAVI